MADGDRKRRSEATRDPLTFNPTEDVGLRFYLQSEEPDKRGNFTRSLVITNEGPELAMLFKVKIKASKNGAKLPIKIKSKQSRGGIKPGQSIEVPVTLVREVIQDQDIGEALKKVTTFQVKCAAVAPNIEFDECSTDELKTFWNEVSEQHVFEYKFEVFAANTTRPQSAGDTANAEPEDQAKVAQAAAAEKAAAEKAEAEKAAAEKAEAEKAEAERLAAEKAQADAEAKQAAEKKAQQEAAEAARRKAEAEAAQKKKAREAAEAAAKLKEAEKQNQQQKEEEEDEEEEDEEEEDEEEEEQKTQVKDPVQDTRQETPRKQTPTTVASPAAPAGPNMVLIGGGAAAAILAIVLFFVLYG